MMKITAVLSDIHGNHTALKTCIQHALRKHADSFIFLGDYVGELACPQKTMQILEELSCEYPCYFVKGNKEEYWINYRRKGENGWKERDSTTGSLLYTYNNLLKKDIDFFESLPCQCTFLLKGPVSLTACHGSVHHINGKLLPGSADTFKIMDEHKHPVILCGHTHKQYRIEYNAKIILNPGSVGVPLNSDGYAQFMLLHDCGDHWKEEFISLPYDTEQAIDELSEYGLDTAAPYWCMITKHLLRTGNTPHGSVLNRAMELCRLSRGFCNWPDIPEYFWEQAIKEMLH